jgi:NADPH-dependent 2,4-dienoyl-CoA reductase/sulfur reductase-like enzyme
MPETIDLLVVGAGPAGLSAAIEAASAGLEVLVVDENADIGGQIYRQLPASFRPRTHLQDGARGRTLIERSRSAGVQFRLGCVAWGLFEPGVMELADESGTDSVAARRIVIAPGAYDRAVPMPGWTLPGVFTVGGAQALLKSQRVLAGARVVLAGAGPLLLVVASQLQIAGATVVAIAEPVPMTRPLRAAGGFIAAPELLRQGLHYRWSLVRGGVPWLPRTALVRIEGARSVEAAVVSTVDADWKPIAGTERRFDADAVCVGYGLIPSTELTRICGCRMEYDIPSRTWVPARNSDMESSIPGIFVAGDGAGIAGAIVAAEEGGIAGVAVARQLGRLSEQEASRRMAPRRRRLARLQRFRRAMDHVFGLRPGLYDIATQGTIACRCEEVTIAELESALEDGADTPGALKSFTRCGMGPCQGRFCAPAIHEWLARRLQKTPEEIGLPPIAPPAKPVVQLGAL